MATEDNRPAGIAPADVAFLTAGGSPTGGVEPDRLAVATWGLRSARPELSAAEPASPWQRAALGLTVAATIAAVVNGDALARLLPFLAIPFVLALALRIHAVLLLLGHLPAGTAGTACVPPAAERKGPFPLYTVLVPLYREAGVVDALVASLGRLAYPADRLQILLIAESVDHDTRLALMRAGLPSHMRVVVVPDGAPRTKPRALNYALAEAIGDYVVVYDAEDEPEPDQLHRALRLLESDPEGIGCVQARLNIYNRQQSWFTRQFTLEYSALFDGLLPALERLDLPVPLGGTSNHFPRRVLIEAGGWDPYNVTEDADLGIRLLRRGRRIAVLDSTTWEEAPHALAVWFPQRTRWLKGWMQTVMVHTRQPRRLVRELGGWRAAGFVLLMGGLIVSALLHPWFYLLALLGWLTGALGWPEGAIEQLMLGMAVANLAAGYAAAMMLAASAVRMRGFAGLARHTGWIFVYWLVISAAAHRALYQLLRAPYLWEKTPHTPRPPGSRR